MHVYMQANDMYVALFWCGMSRFASYKTIYKNSKLWKNVWPQNARVKKDVDQSEWTMVLKSTWGIAEMKVLFTTYMLSFVMNNRWLLIE